MGEKSSHCENFPTIKIKVTNEPCRQVKIGLDKHQQNNRIFPAKNVVHIYSPHLLISPFMAYGAFFQALASFPTRKKTAINAKGPNQVYSASLVKLA